MSMRDEMVGRVSQPKLVLLEAENKARQSIFL